MVHPLHPPMKFNSVFPGVLALAVLGTSPLLAQDIVYQLTERSVSQSEPFFPMENGLAYADGASLGGSERFVTEASLRVLSSVERTGDVTFSLYGVTAADPSGGQPGVTPGALAAFQPGATALGSVTLNSVNFGGNFGPTELIFSGLDTLVGDDLFWAIEFNNVTGLDQDALFGVFLGNSDVLPVTGSATDPSRLYRRGSGASSWELAAFDDPTYAERTPPLTSSLAVSISATAVPEPTVAVLGLLGVMGLLRRRRAA